MNPSFSFPKSERVRTSFEFRSCLTQGRRYTTKNLKIFVYKGGAVSRLGVIVSKDVGQAVIRNEWKRKLRECFRLRKHAWKNACDIVVMVRVKKTPPPTLKLLQGELDRELTQ